MSVPKKILRCCRVLSTSLLILTGLLLILKKVNNSLIRREVTDMKLSVVIGVLV